MACKQLRTFPITSFGTDGYPVVGMPVKPLLLGATEQEINLKKVSYVPKTGTATLEADDRQEEKTVTTGFTLSVELYGYSPDFLESIGLASKDKNGNLIFLSGENSKHVCIFAKGQNQKGAAFELWFYDCVAKPLSEAIQTQLKSEVADAITIEFSGRLITTSDFGDIPYAKVLSGTQGYVSGEPTTTDLYKGVTA